MSLTESSSTFPVYQIVLIFFSLYYVSSQIKLYFSRRKIKIENRCGPVRQYPHKDPFGIDMLLINLRVNKENTLLAHREALYRDYSPTFLFINSSRRQINTIEPANVQTILKSPKTFGNAHKELVLHAAFGHGIFVSDGARWEASRALVKPSFTRDRITDLKQLEVHVQELIRLVPKDGQTVDLQDLFMALTLDSVTEFLLGEPVHALQYTGKGKQDFAEAMEIAQDDAMLRGPFGILNAIPYQLPRTKRAIKVLHGFIDKLVDRALESQQSEGKKDTQSDRYIFLNELITRTQDRERIRGEIKNILFAGRDTTASTFSIMWFTLARRPDIWAKLKAEIATLNGQLPTYETLKGMKYLNACIDETLRLYPSIPINSRVALKDTVLPTGGGPNSDLPIFVAKDTVCGWHPWVMHRRKDIYGEDAEEFRPERWETLKHPEYAYVPFNKGPRTCIGQQFALIEIAYTSVRMIQTFESIETRDPEPWVARYSLALTCKNGVKVSLTRR